MLWPTVRGKPTVRGMAHRVREFWGEAASEQGQEEWVGWGGEMDILSTKDNLCKATWKKLSVIRAGGRGRRRRVEEAGKKE